MIGQDAQPLGKSLALEKPTSLDAAHRKVESAPPGKTMFQTVNNSLEEFTSFLHQHRNLNRDRAKDSRRDMSGMDISKLTHAAFSLQQVSKVEAFSHQLTSKSSSPTELVANLKSFAKAFSKDFTEQNLALLGLKQELENQPGKSENAAKAIAEIDRLLEPALHSREFQAGALGYSMVAWADEQGVDKTDLKQAFQSSAPVKLENMQNALSGLKKKFGDSKIESGTQEMFKQLSAQYHTSGRNIDKAELMALMADMGQLKTLLALFDECSALSQLLVPHDRNEASSDGFSAKLLDQVVTLQNKSWVEKGDVNSIVESLGLDNVTSKNILGVQLKRIIGLVPEHMYLDDGQKQQSLDTIFQFMDLMARKEAGYA